MKNRILINKLAAVLLIIAMMLCLFSCEDNNGEEISEYDKEMARIIYEKQQLYHEKDNLKKGVNASISLFSYISFIFTELDAGLYNDVLPVLTENGPFVGVMAYSEDELPGGEGNITVEQHDELISLGWGNALYWNGEGELSAFLNSMEHTLGALGIDMPLSVVFGGDSYHPDHDAVLLEYGIENAVQSGKGDYSLIEKDEPIGIWHPGITGWRTSKISTKIKSTLEASGGYSTFMIVFDNSPENSTTSYYHIEGESVSNGMREEVFVKMLINFKRAAEKETILVLTVDASREAAKTHFDDIRKYEEESSRRIAEIDIQIAALDREMIDLYEKYN